MTKNQLAGQKQSQRRPPAPKDFDEHMTWQMRWYLIKAIPVGYSLSIIGGLIGYWITRDSHYLLFIAPTPLIPFVYYLVPMDKKKYELELAKIHNSKALAEEKLRVQLLEAKLAKLEGDKISNSAAKT